MAAALASLSIAARATINMHSLNNEGGEGNQIQTRMVDIVGDDGRLHNVNAISGDMLKHIQAQHLYELATAQNLPLCAGCRRFNANRINADEAYQEQLKQGTGDVAGLDLLLRKCALDDMAGILVTAGNRSLPRKSVIEFGWVLGIPGRVTSDSYFHVKYATERSESQRKADAAAREGGANLGQAIFHRPASSGVYAIVCHLELARIGYNDISQTYAVDEIERTRRAQALVESLCYTFVELNGAMRATQLPHLVALDGIITTSTGVVPAPLVSPLMGGAEDREAYRQQLASVVRALDGSGGARVGQQPFDTLSDFVEALRGMAAEIEPATFGARR